MLSPEVTISLSSMAVDGLIVASSFLVTLFAIEAVRMLRSAIGGSSSSPIPAYEGESAAISSKEEFQAMYGSHDSAAQQNADHRGLTTASEFKAQHDPKF